jgi:hypothetical protein
MHGRMHGRDAGKNRGNALTGATLQSQLPQSRLGAVAGMSSY